MIAAAAEAGGGRIGPVLEDRRGVDQEASHPEDRIGRAGQPVVKEAHVRGDRLTVAIDGPAAAGKSTVASEVARRLDAIYFDTGIIYRALALAAIDQAVDPLDSGQLTRIAETLDLQVRRPTLDDGRLADVISGGRDITWEIRTPQVERIVSAVSAHASVRAALLELQRRIGSAGRVIIAGRDIGSVVMPEADLKIWLDASLAERARRRQRELAERGTHRSLDQVRDEMRARDQYDASRDVAPMRPAPDAVVITSDGRTIESIVDQIVELVGEVERAEQR